MKSKLSSKVEMKMRKREERLNEQMETLRTKKLLIRRKREALEAARLEEEKREFFTKKEPRKDARNLEFERLIRK